MPRGAAPFKGAVSDQFHHPGTGHRNPRGRRDRGDRRVPGVSDRIIGVDVGGTKIAAAALEGGVLGDVSLTPTETHETERFLDQLAGIVMSHEKADAVGIAVPSVVDFATGTARFSVNVPLQHVPLRATLSERLGGIPVFIDNDAACAALAEALDDDHNPVASVVVMITVGTGVGGGIVMN